MTDDEYMSAGRFPLTTQPGLTRQQQFFIDAFNLDALRAHAADVNELSGGALDRLVELEAKEAARAAMAMRADGP